MKTRLMAVCVLMIFVATGALAGTQKPAEVEVNRIDGVPQLRMITGEAVPMNSSCDAGNVNADYWIGDWLFGEEEYAALVDPTSCGCSYNLVVPQSVNVFFYAEPGIEACGNIAVQAGVRNVDWDSGCPMPGDDFLCWSPVYEFAVSSPGAYLLSLPLDPCAPISGPFFVTVTYPNIVCDAYNVVIDDSPQVCNSYNDWGLGWVDLVDDIGFPGNLSIYATLECAPALEATIDIDPNTLNLKSQGEYVTCYIEVPGWDPANIDVSTVMLNGIIPAEASPTDLGDYDMDGIPDLMLKFSRGMLISSLGTPVAALWVNERGAGRVPLASGVTHEMVVTGLMLDGTPFAGSDEIMVINPGGGHDDTQIAGETLFEVYSPPAGGAVEISFGLGEAGHVSLRIFDVAGRLVRTLEDGSRNAGTHNVTWDRKTDEGRMAGSGVYFIKLERPGGTDMQKLLVVE